MARFKLFSFIISLYCLLISEFLCINSTESSRIRAHPPTLKVYAKLSNSYWFKVLNTAQHKDELILRGPILTNNFRNEDGWNYLPPEKESSQQPPPAWTYKKTETNEIFLECTAPYPIEWVYNGDGWGPDSPERLDASNILKKVTISYSKYLKPNHQNSKNFISNPSSSSSSSSSSTTANNPLYEYKATIDGLYLYERITGEYVCQRAAAIPPSGQDEMDHTQAKIDHLLHTSKIYLFVPYNAPKYNEKTKQYDKPLPVRNFLKYDSKYDHELDDDVSHGGYIKLILPTEDDTEGKVIDVNFPCSTSDPNTDVTLYKIYDDGEEKLLELDFDNKTGFTLTTSANAVPSLWGEYVCKINSDNNESLKIFILPPKDYEIQVSPQFPITFILSKTREVNRFECKTKQLATISIKYDQNVPETLVSTKVMKDENIRENSGFPYKVTLDLVLIKPTAEEISGEINCLIVKDTITGRKRILHSWRFVTNQNVNRNVIPFTKHGSFYDYDSKTRTISCNTEYPGLVEPLLEKVDCGSSLECMMRRFYYLKDASDDSPVTTNSIKLKYQSVLEEGLLKCSVGRWWSQESEFMINRQNGYVRFKRNAIDDVSPSDLAQKSNNINGSPYSISILDKEEWSLPVIDEIIFTPKNEFSLGDKATFKCHFPKRSFATGDGSFSWWIERFDGSVVNNKDDIRACNTEECKINLNDETMSSIHCSTSSYREQTDISDSQIVIASLRIVIKVPSLLEPPNIQLAFVRANQDFEQIDQSIDNPHYNSKYNGYRFESNDFGDKRNDGQILYLQCRASYPIEWTYSGYFAPEIMSTSQRYLQNLNSVDDVDSYYFITEVLIRTFNVKYTGEYICRKINDHGIISKAYLFFAEPSSIFLPHPEDSIKVQYATLTRIGSQTDKFVRRFQVPCPISDPLRNISLWREDTVKKTWSIWPNPSQLKYNPKFGFEIYPESNPIGSYECHDDFSGQISMKTIVTSKIESSNEITAASTRPNFMVTPPVAKISLNPPRIVVLVCESRDSNTLIFSDPQLQKSLVKSSNSSGNTNFQHSALVVVETFKIKSNYSTISCIQKDKVGNIFVLHTWTLTSEEQDQNSLQKLKTFAVTPSTNKILLFPPRVIVLVCEAHEEVTLIFSDQFSNSNTSQQSLVQSSNSTGNTKFQYSALTVIDTNKRKSGFFTVACVRNANQNLILHTWRLTNEDDLTPESSSSNKPTFTITPSDSQISLFPLRIQVLVCESFDPVTFLFSHKTPFINFIETINATGNTNYPFSALAIIDTSKVEATFSTVTCLTKDKTNTILHKWRLSKEVSSINEISSTSFSITPKESEISPVPPRIQILVCESHDEVTLLFSDPSLSKTLVVSKNATGNTIYQYSALAIIETFKLTQPFSTVSCVKVANPKIILHKWRLTNLRAGRITRMGFDNSTDSYFCCSNGYLKPQLSLTSSCHSVTECRFQACLKNPKCLKNPNNGRIQPEEYGRDIITPGLQPGCASIPIKELEANEGMILCDLGIGETPFSSFNYLLFHHDIETNEKSFTTLWNINSGLESHLPDSILKIENGRRGRHFKERIKKFICHGSKYFFSLGFYWELEHEDGSIERIQGSDKMTINSIYKSILEIEAERLADVTKVYCFAPVWNSYLWRNVSITI